jgi:hypothetical protein
MTCIIYHNIVVTRSKTIHDVEYTMVRSLNRATWCVNFPGLFGQLHIPGFASCSGVCVISRPALAPNKERLEGACFFCANQFVSNMFEGKSLEWQVATVWAVTCSKLNTQPRVAKLSTTLNKSLWILIHNCTLSATPRRVARGKLGCSKHMANVKLGIDGWWLIVLDHVYWVVSENGYLQMATEMEKIIGIWSALFSGKPVSSWSATTASWT